MALSVSELLVHPRLFVIAHACPFRGVAMAYLCSGYAGTGSRDVYAILHTLRGSAFSRASSAVRINNVYTHWLCCLFLRTKLRDHSMQASVDYGPGKHVTATPAP